MSVIEDRHGVKFVEVYGHFSVTLLVKDVEAVGGDYLTALDQEYCSTGICFTDVGDGEDNVELPT